jgi:hypothetical protein
MYIHVHDFMNMYIHVCIMFRHVHTVFHYPVQVGRTPDDVYCQFGDTSGILTPWTGSGKIIRTCTYQYIPVHVSTSPTTGITVQYILVRTGTHFKLEMLFPHTL